MYQIILAFALFVVIPSGPVFSQSTASDDTNVQILKRLDEILGKIERLEARISKLEGKNRVGNRLWVDKYGVVWNSTGDSVGVWGIDEKNTEYVR
jgi:tetrahydromethanopterin S-methyltransferase subunit G